MQRDMHFYGIYALARAAGIRPDVAQIIAQASQFVDDAIEGEAIVIENHQSVLPTMTSHKPLDYQNTIELNRLRGIHIDATFNCITNRHFLPAY